MDKPPFQLGDTVYVVQGCRSVPVEKTCPVCFGKRCVTVILGNRELENVLCDYCGNGYEGPRGYVVDHEPQSAVRQAIITGASFTNHQWEFALDYGRTGIGESELYRDAESAEAARAKLMEEIKKEEVRMLTNRVNYSKTKLTWRVGYHRKRIRDLEREAEYHRKQLCVAVEKQEKQEKRKAMKESV